ncbi:hypothetical protein NA56DRAFT_647884 [Hyaloscypha hepaticicola]|uniref:Uncharacterized protein n=1 Tax=Hyaloscypha hepaticicola TaxID=2082293 RepID=A0A2J6PWV5_9HELO|nr:hypothetical protein NA56DRAFT_647884 [Hyaloscypha hepaticicola]
MGKTYIVAPNYSTRAPPYPWKKLAANVDSTSGADAGADTDLETDAGPSNDIAASETASATETEPPEAPASEQQTALPTTGNSGVEDDLARSAAPDLAQPVAEVEATKQSSAVSPALLLGDILRNPLGDELVAINRKDRKNILPEDIHVPDIKQKFRTTRKEILSGRFGIWATLFAALGLPAGIDLGLFLERNSENIISASELVTFEFEADQQFVNDSMHLASITTYLQGYPQDEAPPPLYMVTGLKVAYGASLESTTSSNAEGAMGIQLPGADTKKILEISRLSTRGEEFGNSTPFVLAFRVRKILYKKGIWEHTLVKKGASMMDGSKAIKESEIEASGLEDNYVMDGMYDEGIDYSVIQDEDVEWILPSDL